MVRRYHRSIYDELDELKASMDYLFQLALEPTDNPLLPAEEISEIVCRYPHNLNAEVSEYDDEVMVTVEMIPGMDTMVISVDLVNTDTVKISCERRDEEVNGHNGSYQPYQRSFSLHHLIPLPVPVTKSGAGITLKNGVLDLHLKKVTS
ncbi:MAG: Hsp20/alpha crystallin family protein [Methanoregula sp.]|nr:Hsp20/alpha crystallin family protein [Methanoregula sp.]MDP2796485.1 Hsp20/alpha crystallin family protein [Methanoregula sp.]